MDVFDDKGLDRIREAFDGLTMTCPINSVGSGVGPPTFLLNVFTYRTGSKCSTKSRSNRPSDGNPMVVEGCAGAWDKRGVAISWWSLVE